MYNLAASKIDNIMEEQSTVNMNDITLLIEEIARAMQNNGFRHFLNLAEMQVITFHEEFDFAEAELEKIEAAPDAYLEIIPDDAKEAFEVRTDFTGSLTNERIQLQLRKALGGSRPFPSFKNVLTDFPEIQQDWYNYNNKHYRNKARQWLLKYGLLADK